jgi:hypothetical protein
MRLSGRRLMLSGGGRRQNDCCSRWRSDAVAGRPDGPGPAARSPSLLVCRADAAAVTQAPTPVLLARSGSPETPRAVIPAI